MAHEATIGLARKHGLTLVYHSKELMPRGETQEIAVEDVVNEENFDLVAAVPTDDPDVAFLATNHIDEELKEAQPFWYLESRSTSVGDVVVTPNGFAYLAMPWGWSVNGQLA